jgi:peptidoglycan L-alanyl-D-glutamate endopeptidase CwlK
MPAFGKHSRERLTTCHPDLQAVLHEAIKVTDFTVLCGYRGEKEQNAAYARGSSKLRYPMSNHNVQPSHAVDCVPYPIKEETEDEDIPRFHFLAGVILATAARMGVSLDWGGHWHSFPDMPHFELKHT